ncbi:MAG: tail fiber protein [Gammaproteobacteria bacterium]|nr:tail fiber protein [Gammaproteobacteria bacterium]
MRLKHMIRGVVAATMLASLPAQQASAQSDPFIGEIMWVGFNFCPRGWTDAAGQLLSISQNSALFSLYGTLYGGDGRTTFGLPDLRGRAPVGQGAGPGLTSRREGQSMGTETETLTVQQMPAHTHLINASQGATDSDPSGSIMGEPGRTRIYDAPSAASATMAGNALTNTGGGQSQNNMQPSLVLRACVALVGVFPSRN